MAKCQFSFENYCKVFHPERFTRPFSKAHYQLFEMVDDPTIKRVLVLAHRGFGKSSIFNFALPSWAIVFDKAKFIAPVSASATVAIMHSENLKRILTSESRFKSVIGKIDSDSFSKEEWTTGNGCFVLPRGVGQQIRGVLHDNSRLELGICDDLETKDGVLSEEQREKLKKWFFSDFCNAVNLSSNTYRIFVIGTVLHEASLLQDLREDSSWQKLEFPLCDDEYKSYWPAFMDDAAVSDLAQGYEKQGLLEEFFLEFCNVANPKQDAVFRKEMFKYYDEGELNLNGDQYENVIIVDPTKSEKSHTAFSAIIGVAYDSQRNNFYIRDIVNERVTTDDLYERIFDMAERLNARVIGIEVTGLEEFVKKPLTDYMLKKGRHYELVWLKARRGIGEFSLRTKGKSGRIAQLAPYYRMGHIYHNPHTCEVLEHQLLNFPRARHWDVMDGTAYLIEMFDLGDRYFSETQQMDGTSKISSVEEMELRELDRMLAEDAKDSYLLGEEEVLYG